MKCYILFLGLAKVESKEILNIPLNTYHLDQIEAYGMEFNSNTLNSRILKCI